ncbi:hypothetical protein [Yeosuana marina]|uniref:hypothetical protein n=1 Tax=Yeosuana marina TaxID=1565536 RepID=UPI001423761C|nr:hypothetical protein [Yeosuana marina]
MTSQEGFKILSENKLNQLKGSYSRLPISGRDSDTSDLFWNFYLRGHDKGDNDFVTLDVIDQRRIKVSLIHNDSIVNSKILKGRLKNNRFVFNRRTVIYPFLLANVYKDSKVRIGLLNNNNLSVDCKMTSFSTWLILPSYDSNKSSGQYEKLNIKKNKDILKYDNQ